MNGKNKDVKSILEKTKKALMKISMSIFAIVAGMEHMIARIFHLTYNEVNILVYYLLIPLSWTVILDYKVGFPVFTILLLLLWSCLYWKVRKNFKTFCDVAFRISQLFLLKFQKIGWNYVVSSVIICVVVPIIIYIGLFYMAFAS